MVQKSKEKLGKTAIGLKETRTSKVRVFQGGRKAAPQKRKVSGVDSKVSSAINNNIEKLMAARVAHEGGHLSVVKAPSNVTEYAKSGPKMSKLQLKLRAGQNATRKRKADEHNSLKKKELSNEINRLETAQQTKAPKRRGPLIHVEAPTLDDDDVAGPFFKTESDELLGFTEDTVTTKQEAPVPASKSMPGRKAGFKGVHNARAAAVLEEGF